MIADLVFYGLQYAIYAFELFLVLYLLSRGHARRSASIVGYLVLLLVTDGAARPAMLSCFGQASVRYAYFYWLTDVVVAVGSFLLIWSFFRRACAREERLWRLVRLLLLFIFVLVVAISALAPTRHYSQLYTVFIVEFAENLYFSCLVLNTLLYVMIQQLAIDDEELALLVCGFGVQFAGEAAGLALYHMSLGENFARFIFNFLSPACKLGMLMAWSYALARRGDDVELTDTESGLMARALTFPAPHES
jgi:hypothetical protein